MPNRFSLANLRRINPSRVRLEKLLSIFLISIFSLISPTPVQAQAAQCGDRYTADSDATYVEHHQLCKCDGYYDAIGDIMENGKKEFCCGFYAEINDTCYDNSLDRDNVQPVYYSCGDYYDSTDTGGHDQCNCEHHEQTNDPSGDEYCCGWYGGMTDECYSTEFRRNDRESKLTLDCGKLYNITQDKGHEQCGCDHHESTGPVDGRLYYQEFCCGWYGELTGECYPTQNEMSLAELEYSESREADTYQCGQTYSVIGIQDPSTCECEAQHTISTSRSGATRICCGYYSESTKRCYATEEEWLEAEDVNIYSICDQTKGETKQICLDCIGREDVPQGIWTAVGCIPVNPTGMIKSIIIVGLLSGGGISFLIILVGAFMLTISQGDPKKTSEAKEMITAALIGLIFIIFSVSILQFIGFNILHIPGFAV